MNINLIGQNDTDNDADDQILTKTYRILILIVSLMSFCLLIYLLYKSYGKEREIKQYNMYY